MLFAIERQQSGDLKGIALKESGPLVANEWKALSAGEKKVCHPCLHTPIPAKQNNNPSIHFHSNLFHVLVDN
jgi:hypothetical protein